MDINPKKMDELFQRAAEGFRPEAPEHSWPEIEKRIRRKKKKGIGFWLSIASLFLIVGGTGAWMGLSTTSITPSQSLAHQPVPTATKGAVPSSSSSISSEQSSANSALPAKPSSSNKASAAPSSTLLNASDKGTVSSQERANPRNASSKTRLKQAGLSKILPRTTVATSSQLASKSARKNRNVRPSKIAISGLFTTPQVLEEDFSKKHQDQGSFENPQQNPVFFASLNSKTPRLASQWKSTPIEWKVEEEPITQEKTKKNLFDQMPGPSWGFVFQPEYVNNWEQLRSAYLQNQNGNPVITPVDPNFRSSLNSLNHNVGFSMAVQSRFAIDLKSSFDLGLSYGFRNDRQNYFECFNPSTGENKLYFQPLTGWNCTAQTFGNTYHYVSMPVGMTHALTGNAKSSGFRLHWNLVPQFLVAGKSMTFDFVRDGFVTEAISKNDVYRRTGLTAGLGLGYAVKINARSLLETGIQWNGNWSTMFNEYYPVDKRFGAIGARIGLVFK